MGLGVGRLLSYLLGEEERHFIHHPLRFLEDKLDVNLVTVLNVVK